MILYKLHCGDDHSFEAWFRDAASFEEQLLHGDVQCPYCGDHRVSETPSGARAEPSPRREPPTDVDSETRATEVAHEILQAVAEMRDHVEGNADYADDLDDDVFETIRFPKRDS